MTGHEDDTVRWADELFGRARRVAGGEPAWRADFAAEASARAHRTRRSRMAGGLSVLAVAAIGAGVYAVAPGELDGSGPAPATSRSGPAPDPVSGGAAPRVARAPVPAGTGVAGYMNLMSAVAVGHSSDPSNPPDPQQFGSVLTSSRPMVAGIIAALDPAHAHLRSGGLQKLTASDPHLAFPTMISGVSTWVPAGDDDEPLAPAGDDRTAYGTLVLDAYPAFKVAPGTGNPIANSPCGIDAGHYPPSRAITLTWSPCVKRPQPDGSVVETTHAFVDGGGTVTAAFRIFPDNAYIDLVASDFRVYTMDGGKAEMDGYVQSLDPGEHIGAVIKPSPFSEQALVAALTGADVRELGK